MSRAMPAIMPNSRMEVIKRLEDCAAVSALKPIALAVAVYCALNSPNPRRIARRVFSSMPSIWAYWLAR